MPSVSDLHTILRRQGVTPASELTRQLGISPATLSRWTSADAGQIVRLGKTRGARYALHNEVEGIGAEWPVWMIEPDGTPVRRGRLHWLHGPASFWELSPGRGPFYDGLPPFIDDMAPRRNAGQNRPGSRQHAPIRRFWTAISGNSPFRPERRTRSIPGHHPRGR